MRRAIVLLNHVLEDVSSNILSNKKRSARPALLSAVSCTPGDCMSHGEALLPLTQLAAFFAEHHFGVKEPWTHYLRLFRLGYLEGIVWKINEMGLLLAGKLAAFVARASCETVSVLRCDFLQDQQ